MTVIRGVGDLLEATAPLLSYEIGELILFYRYQVFS